MMTKGWNSDPIYTLCRKKFKLRDLQEQLVELALVQLSVFFGIYAVADSNIGYVLGYSVIAVFDLLFLWIIVEHVIYSQHRVVRRYLGWWYDKYYLSFLPRNYDLNKETIEWHLWKMVVDQRLLIDHIIWGTDKERLFTFVEIADALLDDLHQ